MNDFTAQQIRIVFFQAPPSPVIMAVLKDSKRRAIVGAFSTLCGAKFISSTEAVYGSDNMETQNRPGETAACTIFAFPLKVF